MKETRLRARPSLKVLLARVQVGLGHLRRDLVERCEHVVGGEHDRLWSRLGVASPRGEDRVPRDARGDAICGQDRLDRLAASRLEDAKLSDTAKLFVGRRAGFA